MNRFTATLLALLLTTPGFAQFKHIAESAPFETPTRGYAKLIQLTNGNTLLLHMDPKTAIDVRVYDEQHNDKGVQTIPFPFPQTSRATIRSAFEINGNVVVMIGDYDDKTPVLYRLIIDGDTGEKLESEKIGELGRLDVRKGYAMALGGVPLPAFFIRKDPFSNNYAVVHLNSFESDRNKRMMIVWYGADNKEINRAYYTSPQDKYKYLEFLDMVVIGGNQVSVLAFAHNTAAHGGKESEMVIANLTSGAREVSLDELSFSHDVPISFGLTRYDPVMRKILLLGSAAYLSGTVIAVIDPFSHQVTDSKTIYPNKASDAQQSMFGRGHVFRGFPQDLFVHADGGFSVVFEERTAKLYYPYGGRVVEQSNSSQVVYGNVAVCLYDTTGAETACYLIPKSHEENHGDESPFFHYNVENTAVALDGNGEYKSYAYVDGRDKGYILFNDEERNAENIQRGRITTLSDMTDCDGYYFPLEGEDIAPARQPVFSQHTGREHDPALFEVYDYNRGNNVFVTLQRAAETRSKKVKVVWLQPS